MGGSLTQGALPLFLEDMNKEAVPVLVRSAKGQEWLGINHTLRLNSWLIWIFVCVHTIPGHVSGRAEEIPTLKIQAQAWPKPGQLPTKPVGASGHGPGHSVKWHFRATQARPGPGVGPTFLGPGPSFSGRASGQAAHGQVWCTLTVLILTYACRKEFHVWESQCCCWSLESHILRVNLSYIRFKEKRILSEAISVNSEGKQRFRNTK
jgi:hypothetical protein